jgi:hypothetical protein
LTNALDNFIENGGCKYNKEEKDRFLYDKFSVQAMSEQYIEVLKNL